MKNLIILIFLSAFLFAQNNVVYLSKDSESLKQLQNITLESLTPNFWMSLPQNCSIIKFDLISETGESIVKIECEGMETEYKVNFPIVMDYIDVSPAKASNFILEKRNLNYISNPEEKLHLKMGYRGNDELKVNIQAKNFVWSEEFIIDFEKEIACVKGQECADFAKGNENMTALENFLLQNKDLRPYFQEVVEKIIENKEKAPEMAKVASIFLKCWLQNSLNVKALYASGLLSRPIFIIHCPDGYICIVCKNRICVGVTGCTIVITDP